MKDEDEIKKKLEEVKYQYFKREYQEKFSCKPENCIHNYRHEEDGEEIGLCMLGAENPEEWPGNVCDDVSTAKSCPFFEVRHQEDELREEFEEEIQDVSVLASDYKDIAALRWVLNGEVDSHFTVWSKIRLFFFRLFVKIQLIMRL
jgi:hypothetical protein